MELGLLPGPKEPPLEASAHQEGVIAAPAADLKPSAGMRRGPLAAVAAFFVAYATLSYYSNAAPDAKGLGVALSICPLLLIGLVLVFRWAGTLTTMFVAVVWGALLYHYLPTLEKNYEWLDLLQQSGVYGLLALSFARSLLPGQVPLCTQLATKMHGTLMPIEVRYTRRATVAWTLFYLALVAAVIVLFLDAPLRIWSLFVNFGTFGLILLMALGDHWWRRAVLPPRPSGGLIGILQRALIG